MFASSQKIKSIRVDADFKTAGGHGTWTTGGATYWLLGVFDQGKAVHTGKTTTLGTYKGSLDFDLYGDSYPNVFAKGDEYKVTINFADGSSIKKSFLSMSEVQPEPPKGKAKLVLASIFDDGKNDLSSYHLPLLDTFRTPPWNNIRREVAKLEKISLFPVGTPQG